MVFRRQNRSRRHGLLAVRSTAVGLFPTTARDGVHAHCGRGPKLMKQGTHQANTTKGTCRLQQLVDWREIVDSFVTHKAGRAPGYTTKDTDYHPAVP